MHIRGREREAGRQAQRGGTCSGAVPPLTSAAAAACEQAQCHSPPSCARQQLAYLTCGAQRVFRPRGGGRVVHWPREARLSSGRNKTPLCAGRMSTRGIHGRNPSPSLWARPGDACCSGSGSFACDLWRAAALAAAGGQRPAAPRAAMPVPGHRRRRRRCHRGHLHQKRRLQLSAWPARHVSACIVQPRRPPAEQIPARHRLPARSRRRQQRRRRWAPQLQLQALAHPQQARYADTTSLHSGGSAHHPVPHASVHSSVHDSRSKCVPMQSWAASLSSWALHRRMCTVTCEPLLPPCLPSLVHPFSTRGPPSAPPACNHTAVRPRPAGACVATPVLPAAPGGAARRAQRGGPAAPPPLRPQAAVGWEGRQALVLLQLVY